MQYEYESLYLKMTLCIDSCKIKKLNPLETMFVLKKNKVLQLL